MRTLKVTLILLSLLCIAATPALRPSQQAALDTILATMDPAMWPMMREQLIPSLSMLDDAQIEMMLTGFVTTGDESADGSNSDDSDTPVATPEDLEFNRQQYEPAIRKVWATSNAFDTFVDAEFAAHCGPARSYAVFGSAWRYEVMPLSPTWQRHSKSADLDVQIIGASYPSQDGRYQFDFSDLPTEFDRASVSRSIAQACSEYRGIGERFMAAAGASKGGEPPADGQRLENRANAEVQGIVQKLETELQRWSNSWILALYNALLNAERVS